MSRAPRIPRRAGLGLVGVLSVAAIAIGVVLIIGGNRGVTRVRAFRPAPRPSPGSRVHASSLPPGPGALVAVLRRATTLRNAPGGHVLHRIGKRSEFDSPQTLWVAAHSGGWLGVISPQVGNGRIGWIPRSAASLRRVNWRLQVSLSSRRLVVLSGGRIVRRYRVAVGQPAAPTPTGRFAVTDLLATDNPTGPYGCCIVALSALAPHAIQGWAGGNRIAIHATTDTGSIGQAVSHGCLRLTTAEGRWLMGHVPLGTPTLISG